HLRGNVFGQTVFQGRTVSQNNLGNTGHLGCLFGDGLLTRDGDEHMSFTADGRSGCDGIKRGALQLGVIVFSNNKICHDQTTFASFFSLSTRFATSGTMMPALRVGGSLTLSVLRRGATSTPSSSGVTVSRGFFFAFMMLGSVT